LDKKYLTLWRLNDKKINKLLIITLAVLYSCGEGEKSDSKSNADTQDPKVETFNADVEIITIDTYATRPFPDFNGDNKDKFLFVDKASYAEDKTKIIHLAFQQKYAMVFSMVSG
jgi:hypothetical protein